MALSAHLTTAGEATGRPGATGRGEDRERAARLPRPSLFLSSGRFRVGLALLLTVAIWVLALGAVSG